MARGIVGHVVAVTQTIKHNVESTPTN